MQMYKKKFLINYLLKYYYFKILISVNMKLVDKEILTNYLFIKNTW